MFIKVDFKEPGKGEQKILTSIFKINQKYTKKIEENIFNFFKNDFMKKIVEVATFTHYSDGNWGSLENFKIRYSDFI
jgi:hypothetical protein